MQQLFIDYAKNPQPSTILVLAHKYGSFDKRTALGKSLPQYCVFVDSKKIKDHEVIPWLEGHLQSLGYTYTEKAVWLMAEKLGNNLERLHKEVETLRNVPANEKIDEGLVSRHIGINREYNAFELQKALITRDGNKAIAIVSYFSGNQKANPFLMVLALLTTYFNKLLSFHHLRKKGGGNEARVLKIPPFVIKEYELAARNFSLIQTRQIIGYLMDADKQIKGVGAYTKSELSIWKELIMKIITV
jgi:DNA polymerase-3 subunit delta